VLQDSPRQQSTAVTGGIETRPDVMKLFRMSMTDWQRRLLFEGGLLRLAA
jgi:hypothetical protein